MYNHFLDYLEGVPQPPVLGTKTITMVINHVSKSWDDPTQQPVEGSQSGIYSSAPKQRFEKRQRNPWLTFHDSLIGL